MARQHPAVVEHAAAYRFAVPPGRLWAALQDTGSFPAWWPWLREFDATGDGLIAGTVLRGVVVPPVPYRMQVVVELAHVEPAREIHAVVRGDLVGPATLRIAPEPAGCTAHVTWRVEMRRPAMRAAARVARPLLVWGHDQVVAVTVARFRGVVERTAPT